jgi:di/tricarboxylate transporter
MQFSTVNSVSPMTRLPVDGEATPNSRWWRSWPVLGCLRARAPLVVLAVLVVVGGVMTMAVAISPGAAVAESGLAADVAKLVERVDSAGVGTTGIIVSIMVVTILLTELLTNTATAALMVPVALSIATDVEFEPQAAAVAVAVLIGASRSFLSPVGYQTNVMVF